MAKVPVASNTNMIGKVHLSFFLGDPAEKRGRHETVAPWVRTRLLIYDLAFFSLSCSFLSRKEF